MSLSAKKLEKVASKGSKTKSKDEGDLEKILRLERGLSAYEDYFSRSKSSSTADKLGCYVDFLSKKGAHSKITKLPLYSFDEFFRPDGEVRVAKELEKNRKMMLEKADRIHRKWDKKALEAIGYLEKELEKLDPRKDKYSYNETKEKIGTLKNFLSFARDLEIKQSIRDEVSASLSARNTKDAAQLNRPPEEGLFRIALRDTTIEGYSIESRLHVHQASFSPKHLLTNAINASLRSKDVQEYARDWWNYTVKTMGLNQARMFYEFVGYLLITSYPLPTERTALTIVGAPNTGKGTHLAGVQKLLTLENLTLYAKASPHKLADEKEHFSRQNLADRILITSGDIPHRRIRDFSPVNDLLGQEPYESEVKFKSPTNEIPFFKALWASTPPLFRITIPGGAWRRLLLISMHQADIRDNSLKRKLLEETDGLFINALIGLSYLVQNDWKFTNEPTDSQVEQLWEFHSDSIAVWVDEVGLLPEPEHIQTAVSKYSTLDPEKSEINLVENMECRQVISDLYDKYCEWCCKLQAAPLGEKTFTGWLREHEFAVRTRTVGEGEYRGSRKSVTYASINGERDVAQAAEPNPAGTDLSWDAYYSDAPLTLEGLQDS